MSNAISNVSEKDFATFTAQGKVIIDFWAAWCGPCRMQGQILDQAASDFAANDIKVGKVNVDEEGELARKFGVSSIPTLVLFKDGKAIKTLVGMQQADALIKHFA
ncbi:MAG: thioredoxin [Oligosphaeraceae bacterium]|nr:thioredoxin [Oligosphaeraceae bacterium]